MEICLDLCSGVYIENVQLKTRNDNEADCFTFILPVIVFLLCCFSVETFPVLSGTEVRSPRVQKTIDSTISSQSEIKFVLMFFFLQT